MSLFFSLNGIPGWTPCSRYPEYRHADLRQLLPGQEEEPQSCSGCSPSCPAQGAAGPLLAPSPPSMLPSAGGCARPAAAALRVPHRAARARRRQGRTRWAAPGRGTCVQHRDKMRSVRLEEFSNRLRSCQAGLGKELTCRNSVTSSSRKAQGHWLLCSAHPSLQNKLSVGMLLRTDVFL